MDENLFKRIYIHLGDCKNGFINYCRPVISMDGRDLKRLTNGQLLTSIRVYGNNALYPLSYDVIEGENKDY